MGKLKNKSQKGLERKSAMLKKARSLRKETKHKGLHKED